MGKLLVAAAACLWGTWPLFLHDTGLSGPQQCFVVLAAMSLPAPFLLRGVTRDRKALLALLLVGIGDAGSMVLYFGAISRGPVAVAMMTHYLAPVLVALSAPVVLGEARSRAALVATPLSLVGLSLLVWRGDMEWPMATAVMGAASAVFYAIVVFAGKAAARSLRPIAITALHAPISALMVVGCFGAAALPTELHAGLWRVAAGGLVCGIGGSLLFYRGLRRISSQIAGALTYLEPLVGALLAVAVLHERMSWLGVVGAAIVLGSGVRVALSKSAPLVKDTNPQVCNPPLTETT